MTMTKKELPFLASLQFWSGNTRSELFENAKNIAIGGTIFLAVLLLLTQFLYWGLLARLVRLCTGFSLLFYVYLGAVMIVLDRKVDAEVERQELDENHFRFDYKPKKPIIHPVLNGRFWLALLQALGLLAAGVCFSVLTSRFKKDYLFDAETFYVTENTFHFMSDCQGWKNGESMSGHEILEKGYSMCSNCRELAEEYEMDPPSRGTPSRYW